MFRSVVQVVNKDSTGTINDARKYKYADIASILSEVNQHLSDCGLAIYHKTEYLGDKMHIVTRIVSTDDSEQFEQAIFPVFGAKPQEIGSSMTYARRYNLLALLDLSTEDDDGSQGNSSAPIGTPAGYEKSAYTPKNLSGAATEAQIGMLQKAYDKGAIEDEEFLGFGGVINGDGSLDFSSMTKQQASDFIGKVKTRQEKKLSMEAQFPPQ